MKILRLFRFVQFPEKIVQDLYQARADAIRKKDSTAYSISSHDIGELYETHTPRVMVNNEKEPGPTIPPSKVSRFSMRNQYKGTGSTPMPV